MQPPATAPDRLASELRRLVTSQVLDEEQADRIRNAAEADRAEVLATRSVHQAKDQAPGGSGVLDVLGYIGGALVLGALIFLGFTLWHDLDQTGRNLVAVGAFVIPAAGGIALLTGRTRRTLAHVLLALACYTAGFAYFTIFSDELLMTSAVVVLAASALAAVTLRSGAYYLPAWTGAMGFVVSYVRFGLEPADASVSTWMGAGFLLVASLLTAAGVLLSRTTAWSLAGLSGWAAAAAFLAAPQNGEVTSLITATLVAAALFVAYVRLRPYAYAVIGCLIVLSIWPVSLYQILDSALGVAVGLVGAGGVLIAVTVLIGRLGRQPRPLPPA